MSIHRKLFESPLRALMILISVAVLGGGSVKAINAWNSRLTPAKILAGKHLFEREWTKNDPLCNGGDGLGPVFNANSCVHCHFQGGVGGSGGHEVGSVTAFTVVPSGLNTVFLFGSIHSDAIDENDLESRGALKEKYPTIQGEQRDVGGGCFASVPDFNPVIFDKLDSPALFGIGELEKVSNLSIALHNAKRFATKIGQELDGNFGGNGVGKSRKLPGGRIGKFGWKAQFATLEEFVAAACANELGLSNHLAAQTIPNEFRNDERAKDDMSRRQLHELVCFVKSLPAPKQILPDNPLAKQRVVEGEQIFVKIGCADCHVKDFGHVEGVYSDFHLYSLELPGAETASGYGIPDPVRATFPEEIPDPDEWRTPPLWGVADSAPYMHDGSAPNLRVAISQHNGDAGHSKEQFENMGIDRQLKLIEFLATLKAPLIDESK